VDADGTPTDYYKIREIGQSGMVLNESQPFIGEEELVKTSLAYEIQDFLRVNVHDEEVVFKSGRTMATTAFPSWNYWPRPEIRFDSGNTPTGELWLSETETINSTIINDINYSQGIKYKIDYNGRIYFLDKSNKPQKVDDADIILASYAVRLFTVSQMNQALKHILNLINLQPGTSKYYSITTSPVFYEPVLLRGQPRVFVHRLISRVVL
jgi:hypothetical protein